MLLGIEWEYTHLCTKFNSLSPTSPRIFYFKNFFFYAYIVFSYLPPVIRHHPAIVAQPPPSAHCRLPTAECPCASATTIAHTRSPMVVAPVPLVRRLWSSPMHEPLPIGDPYSSLSLQHAYIVALCGWVVACEMVVVGGGWGVVSPLSASRPLFLQLSPARIFHIFHPTSKTPLLLTVTTI